MNESADKELKGYTHTKVTIRLTFDMNTLEFQSEKSETTARTHTHTFSISDSFIFAYLCVFIYFWTFRKAIHITFDTCRSRYAIQ